MFLRLESTAHGRALLATQAIPTDTLVHTCEAPYASVVQRNFRKEVCGFCFAYSFDVGRCTWNVRSAAAPGVWFCGDACQDIWDTRENVDGIIGLSNSSIEKAVARMRKNQAKIPAQAPTTHHHDVSRTKLDSGWESAEKYKQNITDAVLLNDTELDIARLAADAIVRRYIEDNPPSGAIHRHPRWAEFMDLQDNELPLVQTRPYIFESYLRVYQFLRSALPPVLQAYLVSSDTVRTTLACVSGNAIGIWQLSPTTDDGEMFGWGVYISGAYFNHSMCSAQPMC